MKYNKKISMTLMEIIVVIIIVSILSMIGVVSYRRSLVNAWQRDAQAMLMIIKNAESVYLSEMNSYVGCNNNAGCNDVLRLHLPSDEGIWSYSVNLRGTDSFCAQATPSGEYTNLQIMSIVGHRSDPNQDMDAAVFGPCG